VAQVYPDFDARPGLTALSRLRHRQWPGEKVRRKKDRNLIREPRPSLCIEEGFRFVTPKGIVEIIDDQATARADIAALARRYHAAAKAEEMARDVFAPKSRCRSCSTMIAPACTGLTARSDP
jgi:hypothetical protein